jgi:branched-chain amino acid transport system substrate-binding protein
MRGVALVRKRALLLCAGLAALALAGCAAQTNSPVTVSGSTLTIYASAPADGSGGQAAADVFDAEQLAFKQSGAKAGSYALQLELLHKAKLTANARTAVTDSSAIAYLGEIVPGTSQDTVPITNELGLLEISPTDTGAYLTQSTAAVSSSPGTYYPSSSTYHQTFARVVPTTAQEAKALVAQMHSLGLGKLYIAAQDTPYGATIALEVRQAAGAAGLSVVSSPSTADAVFYGGAADAAASAKLNALAAQSPSAKLFASSALYDDQFVSTLGAAARSNLYVSAPGFAPAALSPGGQQFASSFASAYGHQPAPQAIFGYEAMSALVAVLGRQGKLAGNRADVVSAFRTLKDRTSVIGTYSIAGGDTSLAPFVIGRWQGGKLVPHAAP